MAGNGMFFQPPYPAYYPVKLDTSGYNYNPAGSIPQPVPKVYTVPGLWVGAKIALESQFTAGVAPVVRTYTWSSPQYDLRPELRGATGSAPVNSVPLWRQLFGVGGRLWVEFSNFNSAPWTKTGLRVTSTEFAHPYDATSVAQIDDPQDITAEFATTADATAVTFVPPGNGYPIRFWRIEVTVEYLIANPGDPNIVLAAAYY